MKPVVWALLGALIAACGTTSTPTAPSPGSPVTQTHAIPSASVQTSTNASICRLPVVFRKFDPTTHSWGTDVAGFLGYPAGDFTPAAGGGVRYDQSRHKWLPAGIPTPDGSEYLYSDASGAVHAVNIDSGQDRIILQGAWTPVGFVGNTLFIAQERAITPGAFVGAGYTEGGLAETDLSGTTPRFVTQHAGPWWVSSLGGWTLDRADGLQQAPDRVLHADLATGVVQPWQTGLGNVTIVGFDSAGHPLVVGQGGVQVVLVVDAQTARTVYAGPRENGWPDSPYYIDGDKVWLSGFSIKDPTFEAPAWLYTPDIGLRPTVGVPGAQVSVAGPCVR